jgi:FemAB-related protein (PEP-CTERM system-associated)
MTNANHPRTLRVGIDECLEPWSPEIKYVFRTLLRLAGFPYEFVRINRGDAGQHLDIYYGPRAEIDALVKINSCRNSFTDAPEMEVRTVCESEGISFLNFFETNGHRAYTPHESKLTFGNDIVFACYWLLTGAREQHYPRDKRDNFQLDGSSFLKHSLAGKPLVSIYGSLLRNFFKKRGYGPLDLPWTTPQAEAVFVLSHDVDYPQIIRSIECLRLLKSRGLKSLRSIKGVLNGTNNFWRFSDWVEFEKRLGLRSAFYFMARKGSLYQYATGIPDAFYDIRSREFLELFRYLKDEGCEVGLHASYNAYQDVEQLRREKDLLEEAAGICVEGNRHHYWRLNPAAPYETLSKHEQVGLSYDSSLAFEFYPGFRRGICHPFHVFHPGERRELKLLELPPAWMDDHFDRRLEQNKIVDPESYALRLVDTARATNGVVVVDYHPRGMNADFYPRYGPWLVRFIERHLTSGVSFLRPGELAQSYLEFESRLAQHSRDLMSTEVLRTLSPSAHSENHSACRRAEVLPPGDEKRWDAYVAAHPDGNIYHTLSWKNVTEDAFGHRPVYLSALNTSGEYAGVLPLFLVKGLWGRRLVSVPMRDRGGVLAQNGETASLLVARAIELTRELKCGYLELRSLEEVNAQVVQEHSLLCEQHWITTRVDLTVGAERLWKSLDKNFVRWAIKKGRRNGLRVEIDNSRGGIETFYDLFCRTRRAMGIPTFPKELFVAIWHHLIGENKANLFFVWKGSEPINGMINFFSKDAFIPAYAAPQNQYRKDYPNEFMFWHTIEWATNHGFRTYDFGADSPRQTGLLKFKKKWGGVQYPIFSYFFLNGLKQPPHFDSSAPTYSALRKIWKLLPGPVSEYLGSRLTSQMS